MDIIKNDIISEDEAVVLSVAVAVYLGTDDFVIKSVKKLRDGYEKIQS